MLCRTWVILIMGSAAVNARKPSGFGMANRSRNLRASSLSRCDAKLLRAPLGIDSVWFYPENPSASVRAVLLRLNCVSMLSNTSQTTNRVNICVVGCGHWGKNLARNFNALGHLYSVCETDPTRLQSLASLYPAAKPCAHLEAVLADSDLDAVVLATPAEEHFRMAMAALRAGKDVFVEKPLTLDWKDGLEMVERHTVSAGFSWLVIC